MKQVDLGPDRVAARVYLGLITAFLFLVSLMSVIVKPYGIFVVIVGVLLCVAILIIRVRGRGGKYLKGFGFLNIFLIAISLLFGVLQGDYGKYVDFATLFFSFYCYAQFVEEMFKKSAYNS